MTSSRGLMSRSIYIYIYNVYIYIGTDFPILLISCKLHLRGMGADKKDIHASITILECIYGDFFKI